MCLTLSILLIVIQIHATLLKQNGAENVNKYFNKLIELTDDKDTLNNDKKPLPNNSNIFYLNKVNKTYNYDNSKRIKPSITIFAKQVQKKVDNQSNIITRKMFKPKPTHKRERSLVEEEISIEEWSDISGNIVKNNPEIKADTMLPLGEHLLRSGSVEAEDSKVQNNERKINLQLSLNNETRTYLAHAGNTFYNKPLFPNIHIPQHLISPNDDKIVADNVNYNVNEHNKYLENVINSAISNANVNQELPKQTHSENNKRIYDVRNLIKNVMTEEPQSMNDEFRIAIASDTITLKPSRNNEISHEAFIRCQSCFTRTQPLQYYYNYKRLFYPVGLQSAIQPDLQTYILRHSLERMSPLHKTRHVTLLSDLLKRMTPKIYYQPSYNSYISY